MAEGRGCTQEALVLAKETQQGEEHEFGSRWVANADGLGKVKGEWNGEASCGDAMRDLASGGKIDLKKNRGRKASGDICKFIKAK